MRFENEMKIIEGGIIEYIQVLCHPLVIGFCDRMVWQKSR